ncbi:uncharacterized protein LOC121771681 isoform X1 [Salvia splendens]|uniref:uncharacterized protein LOC121771681 isoform X1 n=1 Tax=Salvia splendens TaxID=180675 RepID=UPI001C27E75C|nr:uncharacterized protein LOC121771681 isoform X1 [Salvia splendens]
MSLRGKEIEEEGNEREMLHHWSHEHPLSLVKTREKVYCYGCEELFSIGEQAYGCSIEGCGYPRLLHAECGAIAREIRHPSHHPQHILIQRHEPQLGGCDICGRTIWSIGYNCSGCYFQMHLRCAQGGGMVDTMGDDDDNEKRRSVIRHPSHPDHELKLWRRSCSFKCDACCTTRKESSSYTCTNHDCQYWIHEKCASLPQSFKREDHHHSLSLSFRVPFEYLNFNYKCDVCNTYLLPNYWIYHCQLCRFIVHVKCVYNKQPRITENIGKDMIHLPTNEVAEELITPFVMRQRGGETLIPPIIPTAAAAANELVKVKYYKFIHHQHQLTLVSSGDRSQEEEEEEDEENYGKRSELMCDGCISPISSSSSSYYYYMSCSECKYNLHLACFHLPPNVPSLPIHQHDDHQLVLRSCDKHQPWNYETCSVCKYGTNGLIYSCTACDFEVDIQCACLPDTIHHAAHPRHLLKHVTQSDLGRDINRWSLSCAATCGQHVVNYDCYRCCNSSCDFIVHVRCAVLLASVSSRRWDEQHPLLLTYDATVNRPGDFYCDQCETQMNPRSWMYHCRACDVSFHPRCFITTSGYYRNKKFGQEYVIIDAIHPHPLTFQLLTTKRHCDICRRRRYENQGFYCALCNFFICLYGCGIKMIKNGDMKAVE